MISIFNSFYKNRKEKKDENFFFSNISGNQIENEKRLKLNDGICDDSSGCSDDEVLDVDEEVLNVIDKDNIN